ncbi:hypothetical protein ACFVAV_17070 [Nocardia sp. NPDC057663]|uniref:hypothetical protein n=1 Tax=Nocardia sp. NPDC057663 TaxID=3346201 RepID=UPI0036715968
MNAEGGRIVASQGWYNHYDDPDEYWDDEPLVVQRPFRTDAAFSAPASDADVRSSKLGVEPAQPAHVQRTTDGGAEATTESLLQRISAFQTYAQETQRLLGSALSAAPTQSTGMDSKGIVTATVAGQRNEFVSANIVDNWENRIYASQLSDAIGTAVRVAERAHGAAISAALVGSGAMMRLKEMRPEEFQSAPPTPPWSPVDTEAPSLNQIADAAFDLVSTSSEESAVSPQGNLTGKNTGEGGDEAGRVTVELSPDGSFVSCTVDAFWAAGRSGSSVSWALNEAVAAARLGLTRRSVEHFSQSPADRLISGAIAYLSNLAP